MTAKHEPTDVPAPHPSPDVMKQLKEATHDAALAEQIQVKAPNARIPMTSTCKRKGNV
jgi:hypothetical protein